MSSPAAGSYPILTGVKQDSPYFENYRDLGFMLSRRISMDLGKVILLTSASSGEGKTLVTANLGISLSLEGKRVLLIDGNLRNAALHKLLSGSPYYGLAHILSGECTFEEAVAETSIPNVSAIFAGIHTRESSPSKFLVGEKIEKLFNQAKEKFDCIIVDSPAASLYEDAKFLASKADSFIFVIQYKKVKARMIKKVVDKFDRLGVKNGGAILNNIKPVKEAKGWSKFEKRG